MRYVITIAALCLIIGVLGGIKFAQIKTLIDYGEHMQKMGPPPEAVNAAPVERQSWERSLRAVATVTPSKAVTLSNDAPGVVTKVLFESGARVSAGEPLIEIDSSVEDAQLGALLPRLVLANKTLDRTEKLLASGVSTQAEIDAQTATIKGLVADIRTFQAEIERKTVRAPFDGKLGLRAVNLGQYLPPGSTLTVLAATAGVFVDFSLPQAALPDLQLGGLVRVRIDTHGEVIAVGKIAAMDSSVDAVTRSIKVRASIPTTASLLRTGMFVNVEVVLPEKAAVVAVPVTALIHGTNGDSVFQVEQKSTSAHTGPEDAQPPTFVARQRFVRLGARQGDYVAVEAGIEAGQTVVTSGGFKLRDQAPISIKNELGLEAQLEPHPENR